MADVSPDVSPDARPRDRCALPDCTKKSASGHWCSLEHVIVGMFGESAPKPKKKAKKTPKRQTRHGAIYELAKNLGVLDLAARDEIELEVGLSVIRANKRTVKLKVTADAWRRTVNERRAELNLQALSGDWSIADEHLAMLGPSDAEMKCLATEDPEAFDQALDTAAEAFVGFRTTFFDTPQGDKYIMKAFHRRWIRSILKAIYLGDRLLILAPPRSGKTDLAIHFAVWLILRNPNVRILWVGASGEMAAKSVDSVRSHLEDNESLRMAYLPAGMTWKPFAQRGGGTVWSKAEFTVATRTVVGSKSPTMAAVGTGGKILSRDTDVIWLDDLEDSTTVAQPGTRDKTREWLDITIESRKEQATALVMIGSRQHPDDLYNHLADKDTWSHIVEAAHDPECALDENDTNAHVECMIFPERLSYAFLMEKKEALDPRSFDMRTRRVKTSGT